MVINKLIASNPEKYYNLFLQFENGGTIERYIQHVERMASEIKVDLPLEHEKYNQVLEDEKNKWRGDSLEVLAHLFFYAFNSDEAVGLTNYMPIDIIDDFGADGVGINAAGNVSIVQIKYRGNPSDRISYGDLTNCIDQGIQKFKMDPYGKNNVFLFTTGCGASYVAEAQMSGRLVVINRSVIGKKINGNITFWKKCYEIIFNFINI